MSHFLRALAPAQEGKREKPVFTKSLLTVFPPLCLCASGLGWGAEAWSPSPLSPSSTAHAAEAGIEPLGLHPLRWCPPGH